MKKSELEWSKLLRHTKEKLKLRSLCMEIRNWKVYIMKFQLNFQESNNIYKNESRKKIGEKERLISSLWVL